MKYVIINEGTISIKRIMCNILIVYFTRKQWGNQARVQEFVGGGGGGPTSENLFFFFLLFNFSEGGGPAQNIVDK